MTAVRVPRLGQRGEGWVVLQLALLAATFAAGALDAGWPGSLDRPAVRLAGAAIGVAGLLLWLTALRTLGRAITPFPHPRADARLVASGVYAHVRHPIYGGGSLILLGYSLLTTSLLAFALTVVEIAVFDAKARLEEAWLEERYPEYAAYRRRTRRRFLPWLY